MFSGWRNISCSYKRIRQENPKVPKELTDFFTKTLKDLYKIFPFELAMLDFEVSGQYYLDDLTKPLTNNWATSTFYVGQKNYDLIATENRKFIKRIEELWPKNRMATA